MVDYISKRCQFKFLVLTFKVFYLQTPPYICDLFHWYTPARILRSASTTSLVPNRHKTIRYGKRIIDISFAALWNGLPDDIKHANNICYLKKQTFKTIRCFDVTYILNIILYSYSKIIPILWLPIIH